MKRTDICSGKASLHEVEVYFLLTQIVALDQLSSVALACVETCGEIKGAPSDMHRHVTGNAPIRDLRDVRRGRPNRGNEGFCGP
jgi:hypothetical protein